MVNEWMLPLFIMFGPVVIGLCIGLVWRTSPSRDLSYRKTPAFSRKPQPETIEEMHQRYKEPRFDRRV